MSLTAKDTPPMYTLIPEGTHVATCYSVVDLGEQPNPFRDDGATQHKVLIGWETPNERLDDDRPMIISQIYTLSLNEKATLRKHLQAWRGRAFTREELEGFDLRTIVGKPCLLSIVHKEGVDRTSAVITGVAALPSGTPHPKPESKTVIYDIDQHDDETFASLPEWIRKKIESGRGSLGLRDIHKQDKNEVPFDSIPTVPKTPTVGNPFLRHKPGGHIAEEPRARAEECSIPPDRPDWAR